MYIAAKITELNVLLNFFILAIADAYSDDNANNAFKHSIKKLN